MIIFFFTNLFLAIWPVHLILTETIIMATKETTAIVHEVEIVDATEATVLYPLGLCSDVITIRRIIAENALEMRFHNSQLCQ